MTYQTPEGDHIGWLVESPQRVRYSEGTEYPAEYLTAARMCGWMWTTDPNRAIRFARREDAEAAIRGGGWKGVRASEHIWTDAGRPPAADAPTNTEDQT